MEGAMANDAPAPRPHTPPVKRHDRDRVFVCAKCRLRGGTLRTVIEAEGRHVYVCFPDCLTARARKETPHGR